MDTDQVAKWISAATAGTFTRGVLWAIAGISAYLTAKGVIVPEADPAKTAEIVAGALGIIVPIVLSLLWSKKKDVKLLNAEPPTG